MTGRQRKQLWNAVQLTLILIATFIMLVPIVWIFLAAFKTHVDVYQLKLFFRPTLENFGTVFDDPYRLGEKLYNSTVVAFVTVVFAIPIATCAASYTAGSGGAGMEGSAGKRDGGAGGGDLRGDTAMTTGPLPLLLTG